jgi:DNA-3-methyladenine glycosylase
MRHGGDLPLLEGDRASTTGELRRRRERIPPGEPGGEPCRGRDRVTFFAVEGREQHPNRAPAGVTLGPAFPPAFYERDAQAVARDLLGTLLVRHAPCPRVGRIVETEAYLGEHDLASHARFGRTGRTEVMYGPPGRSYVYLIYGMYDMLNVVCAEAGDPQAVLVRALEPVAGIDARVDGPGRLTRTLAIDRSFNGLPLTGAPLSIHPGAACSNVVVTPRVGIDYAGVWRDAPLRFVDGEGRRRGPGTGAAR